MPQPRGTDWVASLLKPHCAALRCADTPLGWFGDSGLRLQLTEPLGVAEAIVFSYSTAFKKKTGLEYLFISIPLKGTVKWCWTTALKESKKCTQPGSSSAPTGRRRDSCWAPKTANWQLTWAATWPSWCTWMRWGRDRHALEVPCYHTYKSNKKSLRAVEVRG